MEESRYTGIGKHVKRKSVRDSRTAFSIKSGSKFALLVLRDCGNSCTVNSPLDLGDGYWFLPSHELPMNTLLTDWFGNRTIAEIRKAQFCLAVIGAVNEDDGALRRRVLYLYDSVIMLALPRLGRGYLFSGKKEKGRLNINSWSQIQHCQVVFRYRTTGKVESNTLRAAKNLAEGFCTVCENKNAYERLERGLFVLEQALKQSRLQDRLHQFVRALEALVKPRKGRNTKDFVHRCRTFVAPNASTAATLRDAYEIRCHVEHLHDGLTAVIGRAKPSEAILKERLAQVEFLSIRTYAYLLSDSSILKHFASDNSINQFWSLQDHLRQAIWRTRVNLATDAKPYMEYEFSE